MMIDFIKTKKTYLMLLAVLFVFISLSETTYSLFLTSNSIAELDYNTGLLDLKFTEDEQITLEKTFPINDSDAIDLKPYILKIENTGSLPYIFDLSLISTSDNDEEVIDSKYIKVKVNDSLPNNLFAIDNKISTNNIIYPGEEKEFKINIWLDISAPNSELGKKFIAKVVTSGSAIYKTLDNSGANHPDLKDGMIPIYYNESTSNWYIADKTNIISQSKWYDYDEQKWANAVILKDSSKKIYDLTRNNDLNVNNIKVNNGNLITEDSYLNIGLSSYNYQNITNILRVKFNDLSQDKIYLMSNANLSYYYDTINKKFNLSNDNNTVNSNSYNIEQNKWYLIGYSYDSQKVTFYINGIKLGSFNLEGQINKSKSNFLVATDASTKNTSKLTIGDILIYNRILKDSEISSNYKEDINIISDGLICGYNEFTPMTLYEYYSNKDIGSAINNNDISTYFVWIPRYKYRLWNVLGNDTDSYNAYQKGIDIVFENNKASTGEIICDNKECQVTEEDNNKYYTHPAFKELDDELTGFWISKYELTTDTSNCNENIQSGCTTNNLSIESKEGNPSWRNNYLSNYYQALKNNGSNYQIIKNTEWGAIAYLSHSKYGICTNNTCNEISANKTYIAGRNTEDTTTANAYGVYDMAGGAMEYTMSSYTNNGKLNTLFNDTEISNKDYELYQIDTFVLGDATKEILLNNTPWYQNTYNYDNPIDKWIVRGSNENKGIFSFTTLSDSLNDNLSTRITIK